MIRSWARSPLPGNQQDAQRIQVGMIHARKIVTVTADDDTFQLDVDGQTVATVPRTSGREIHRYKAYATQQPRRPR